MHTQSPWLSCTRPGTRLLVTSWPCPLEGASGDRQGHCLSSPQPPSPPPPPPPMQGAAPAPPSAPGLASQGWGDGFSGGPANVEWSGGWSSGHQGLKERGA